MKADRWTAPEPTEQSKKKMQEATEKGQKEYYESKKSGDYTGD